MNSNQRAEAVSTHVKATHHAPSQTLKYALLIGSTTLLGGGALIHPALAAWEDMRPEKTNYGPGCHVTIDHPQDIKMDLGRIVLRPDMAPGTVISAKQFPISRQWVAECSSRGTMIGILSNNYTASELGNNIYKTNIPGIGLRLYREGEGGRIKTFYPHTLPFSGHSKLYLDPGYFSVEVIRLPGPTGAGRLNAGLYSIYYADSTGPSKPVLTSHVYGDGITIVNSTCSIDAGSRDITVDMGSAASKDFSGVGSTLNEKKFNIRLNCVGGNESKWSQKRGDVSLAFYYTPNERWGNQGVIQPERNQSAAQGVGIQLLSDKENTPVKNGDYVYAGRLQEFTSSTINIPMKARFYQTENKITGGSVSALTTFTVVYQ